MSSRNILMRKEYQMKQAGDLMRQVSWKKLLLLLCILSSLFLLSGCSFSDLMSWGTGVKQDPDYQTWEKLSENGKLNSDGQYTADAVHVTFAKNNFLNIRYYSDPNMANEHPETGCYLLPGDYIYYSINTIPSMEGIYFFDHLDIMEYSQDGDRISSVSWNQADASSIMIPYDYKGTEISIEPIGHFGDRQFTFKVSTGNNPINTVGTWRVNNEVATANTIYANALDNYYVEYYYDSSLYYLVSASPAPWKTDEGIVVFDVSEAKTGTESYVIDLDSYVSASIAMKSGEISSISSDPNASVSYSKKDSQHWTASKVRNGSKITIQASSDSKDNLEISCPLSYKIGDPYSQDINGQHLYSYEIEFGDVDKFMFIPAEYTYPHGTIAFYCDGKLVSERMMLESGMKIEYRALEVEDGFWLPEDGGIIVVNGSKTANELRSIKFYQYKYASILLPQPISGGRISYSTDTELLDASSVELLCGTKIYADFHADNGWEAREKDHYVYIVSDAINQAVSFSTAVADIFEEKESHKPKLTVNLHSNLGPCKTGISASGCNLPDQAVNGGNSIFDAFKTVVSDKKIGTDQGVTLSFSNIDLPNDNNALRVTVNKETKSGGYKDIYYVNKANYPIVIPFDKGKEYTSIKIQIEAVKADAFNSLSIANADVTIRYADITPDDASSILEIASGVLISGERQIEVTIIPHDGFFMDGPNTVNDKYSRKLSYDEYKKLDQGDLQKQLKTICTINLNTEDIYGTVEYFVDGKSYSGSIDIGEGKEILIKYVLTDEACEIIGDRDIITQAISLVDGNVNRKIEVHLKVTSDLNGTTLTREDVIEIRKKVTE